MPRVNCFLSKEPGKQIEAYQGRLYLYFLYSVLFSTLYQEENLMTLSHCHAYPIPGLDEITDASETVIVEL